MDQRGAEVDGVNSRLIIARHESDTRFSQELLHLAQIEIDLFAPAIHNDAHFLTRVTESIEDLECALCTANRGNVECQDQDDLVRLVERGERDGVERVLRIEYDVVEMFAQFL